MSRSTTLRTSTLIVIATTGFITSSCGSRASASSRLLSVTAVERAYRASGYQPIADLVQKTPSRSLGDFYLGRPEPLAHIIVFKSELDAQRAPRFGIWRKTRVRNVVITFIRPAPRAIQLRMNKVLIRLAERTR
jgi:hypothetical protein